MATSLFIAHPSRLSCEALCRNFEASHGKFRVLGWSVQAAESLEKISQHSPDVALISAALREGPNAGFDMVRELRSSRHSTRTVILLPPSEDEVVLQAFSAGAKGVLFQTDGFQDVCKCLRCIHAGQVWANSHHMQIIIEALAQTKPLQVRDVKGKCLLTAREEQIVRMLAEGLPNLGIANALHLSSHTVKNHLFRIYEKLGISNRAELILYAICNNHSGTEKPDTTNPSN